MITGIAAAIALFARFGPGQMTAVTGLIGSETAPFFADVRVQKELARHKLQIAVRKASSREIATRPDLSSFDFAFPAGVPGAEKIQREASVSKAHNPFFTPLVIASWQPIADLLVRGVGKLLRLDCVTNCKRGRIVDAFTLRYAHEAMLVY